MAKLKSWKELEIGGVLVGPTALANKTGSWKTFYPKVNLDKCIHCMQCVVSCPDNAMRAIKNDGRYGEKVKMPYILIEPNLDYCKGCGICAEVCPVKAIEMLKK